MGLVPAVFCAALGATGFAVDALGAPAGFAVDCAGLATGCAGLAAGAVGLALCVGAADAGFAVGVAPEVRCCVGCVGLEDGESGTSGGTGA